MTRTVKKTCHICSDFPLIRRLTPWSQLTHDEPIRHEPGQQYRGGEREPRCVRTSAADQQPRGQGRHNTGHVTGEVFPASPDSHLVSWRAALQDDEEVAG